MTCRGWRCWLVSPYLLSFNPMITDVMLQLELRQREGRTEKEKERDSVESCVVRYPSIQTTLPLVRSLVLLIYCH